MAASSVLGIWPVITDIEVCSWPATTDSTPRNIGLFLYCERYSISGYWNSCTDCQRHMIWLGGGPDTRPLGCTGGLLFCHVVVGPCSTGGLAFEKTTG